MHIRKIQTEEQIEKKRKRNGLILAIVMISILLFSTAGYFSFQDKDNNAGAGSGENEVENIGDSWIVNYGGQRFSLGNSPESAENVSVVLFKKIENYYGKNVYVASDNDAATYEVSSSLGRYVDRMQPACYGKCDKDLPEKDCNETMIVVKSLNLSEDNKGRGKVYEADNCVFIEGGLVEVDAFIYDLFGVKDQGFL